MKCPYCMVEFFDQKVFAGQYDDGDGALLIERTACPKCLRLTLLAEHISAHGGTDAELMLYPRAPLRPVAPQVPEPYASLFTEAALILSDSPRASAALSRRCLQQIIREQAKVSVPSRKLYDEIQYVIDNKLVPSHLAESLHALRDLGNMAAHPKKSEATGEVVEVEPGEAAWTLDTLEGLFDFFFVEPAKTAARKAALDAKLGRTP